LLTEIESMLQSRYIQELGIMIKAFTP